MSDRVDRQLVRTIKKEGDNVSNLSGWNARSLFVVILCFLTIAVDGYDLIVYGATVPHLLKEPGWNLTATGVGLIGSWTLVGLMAGLLGAGPLADRIGRRKQLLIGVVWFSIGTFLCSQVSSPFELGVARFLCGIGLGAVVPSSVALSVEYAPSRRRQMGNAIALTGYSVGGVVSALVALALLQSHGWRSLYFVGSICILLVPLMYFTLPESVNYLVGKGRVEEARRIAAKYSIDFDRVLRDEQAQQALQKEQKSRGSFRMMLSPRMRAALIMFALMAFFGQMVVYGLNVWLPMLMRKQGYPLGSALESLLIMQCGAALGGLGGAWLADRLGSRRVIVPFFIICAASLLVLSQKPQQFWLMVALFGSGAGSIGSTTLGYGYIAEYFPAVCRASAIGVAQGLGRIGSVIGPMLGSWVVGSNFGNAWNFYAYVIPALLAALVVLQIPGAPRVEVSEERLTNV
ncbi:aromatic acid/H+ symport family MFS transporter [Paraburkholderia sp. A3BS-1L]|uniref:MFS transporter n=1 Tax=Paraburkholderia sp. A3BS-1L TaxID=3028375 RepID=UPI003DA8E902